MRRSAPFHSRPRGNEALLTAVVVAVVAAAAPAQRQFDELRKRGLPADEDTSHAVAFADVDGDGDLDVVFGNDGQNRLYLNDGSGTFTDDTVARLPVDVDGTMAVAAGDVDGDGDFDLVFGNNGQNRLYLNNGAGTFADATAGRLPAHGDDTRTVVLGDVDGDGDLDLVEGNYGNYPRTAPVPNRLYLNDGTGKFTESTTPPGVDGYTQAMALGDADGDGDLDLVTANHGHVTFWVNGYYLNGGQNWLHVNNGSAGFTDVTAAQLPQTADMTSAVAMGDVDGDGDLDLVFGDRDDTGGYKAGELNRLYLNDGRGNYTNVSATHLPRNRDATTSLLLADVDGDGDLDMLAGSAGHGTRNRLYLNNGSGVFADVTAARMPFGCPATLGMAVGDVDGDGNLDIGLACRGQNRLYLADGTGTWVDATAGPLPADCDSSYAVASGDVDGDGDLDLVFGNGYLSIRGYLVSALNRLLLNDGTGAFTDATATNMPALEELTVALALGDVDRDGDLDLVAATSGQDRLYLNDGSGRFTDATAGRLPGTAWPTNDVALADVDGDGDLDLFLVRTRVRLLVNDGSGRFTDDTAARMPAGAWKTSAILAVDVDGDGDLDLVLANSGEQNRLYLNDGSGTYSDGTAQLPPDTDSTGSVAFGDVDGDGDPDLVFGNSSILGQQNKLYLNDGSGRFTDATAARLPGVTDDTTAVQLGDLDGDGDLDLVVANYTFYANQLYLNDGSGTYSVATTRMPESRATAAIALADFDRDGDLDMTFANLYYGGANQLLLNLQRQLHTPWLLRSGGTYTLEAFVRYGPPSTSDVALPVLSAGTASIPVPPFGTLGLDPTTMVAATPIVISRPAGVGSVSYSVPAVPSLVGLGLYAQALIVHQTSQARLSDVTADVFLR